MVRTIGLHLNGTRAARPGRPDGLRDMLAGAVLLVAWLAIWAFLALGVAGPLGSLQRPSPQAAAHERA